jgi:hypothetical protein
MKPLPAPHVPGETDWQRFDNAVRMAFGVKPEAIQKERERIATERAKKKRAKKAK